MVITFSEALDNNLYGGGIQAYEEIPCARCGEDIGEDAIEVDGEHYCRSCERTMVRAYLREIKRLLPYTSEGDSFKTHCIKLALEEYGEYFEE